MDEKQSPYNTSKLTVPFLDSYWVVPGKLLAGEYPGSYNPSHLIARVTAVLAVGIETFVDLTEERELEPYYSMLRVLGEPRKIEVAYARMPIRDQSVPSKFMLGSILNFIDRSIAHNKPAYVHCYAGRGRTGTVVGAYLIRHGFSSPRDVLDKIAELRRSTPHGWDSSPQTMEQVELIRNWKRGE